MELELAVELASVFAGSDFFSLFVPPALGLLAPSEDEDALEDEESDLRLSVT